MNRRLEWLGAVLIFVAVAFSAAFQQRPAPIFGDAAEYYRMAQQFRLGHTGLSVGAPFVFRPLTPLLAMYADGIVTPVIPRGLAAAIVGTTWAYNVAGFYAFNLIAALAATILLVTYLRCFFRSAALRLVLVTYWLIQWHTPVRYTFFNPVNIEPLFLAFATAGLLAIERLRARRLELQAFLITLLVVVGVFAREAMTLLAATFIGAHWRARPKGLDRLLVILPLFGAGAAIACTRVMYVPSEPYQPWSETMAVVRSKPLWTWVLAWFYTFGPVALAIIGSALWSIRDVLRRRPELGVYLAGCGALAFVGGTDTERILGWAYPAMLVLVGTAINARLNVLESNRVVAIAMTAAALVSARIFWPIPPGPESTATPLGALEPNWHAVMVLADKFFVIENYYSNLWSYFGSRSVHLTLLVLDIVFASALAVFIARQHARLSSSPSAAATV